MFEDNEIQYWAGGFHFDSVSQFQDFIDNKKWECYPGDENKNHQMRILMKSIKEKDQIVLKSYGGRHDLVIHAKGIVTNVSKKDQGFISVDWDINGNFYYGKAPRGLGAGNWHNALIPVTRAEDLFLFDSNFQPRLNSIEIKNYFAIKDGIILSDLKGKKEIYFLGENGDGKTLILQGIILALYKNFILTFERDSSNLGKILDIIESHKDILINEEEKIESVFIAKNINDQLIENSNSVFAYGTRREIQSSTRKFDLYGFMNLFDGDFGLKDPIEWLKELDRNEARNYESSLNLQSVKSILEDLLGKAVEKENNVKILIQKDIVFLERGTKVTFSELSEGYRTTLIWVCDLLYRLAEKQPNIKKIEEYKGIVLVDEIDLHLHPKWAYSIVHKLRTWFPKIQFFFTTHSPIVILGASPKAIIYKVFREGGNTTISEPYEKKDLVGLLANTLITSPLFGLHTASMSKETEFDSSPDYLSSRIYKKIKEKIEYDEKNGKVYISKEAIDQLISDLMSEEE